MRESSPSEDSEVLLLQGPPPQAGASPGQGCAGAFQMEDGAPQEGYHSHDNWVSLAESPVEVPGLDGSRSPTSFMDTPGRPARALTVEMDSSFS